MYTLATAGQLRARLGLAPDDTPDDGRLWRALQAATARIEGDSGRRFTPRLATLAQDWRDPRELVLSDDLLHLQRLTNGDGHDIDPDDIQGLPVATEGCLSVLRLRGPQHFSGPAALQVTGIWGWHERWSQAWQNGVDALQDDPLSAAATILRVSDSGRFQAGQLLRLDDEYLRLLTIDSATHSLGVSRAAQGTQALAHSSGAAIDLYLPPPAVTLLCLRLALWLYREPDRAPDTPLPAGLAQEVRALRRDSARA